VDVPKPAQVFDVELFSRSVWAASAAAAAAAASVRLPLQAEVGSRAAAAAAAAKEEGEIGADRSQEKGPESCDLRLVLGLRALHPDPFSSCHFELTFLFSFSHLFCPFSSSLLFCFSPSLARAANSKHGR
jgi:hypothetical protein